MKKYFLILAIAFVVLACKKDKTVVNTSVFGKWELRAKSGGFTGATTKYAAGNGDIYQFNNDSTYTWTEKDRLLGSGKFHISITGKEKNMQYGTIKFDGIDENEMFTFKTDTISVGSMIAEAMISTYVKVK